MPSISANDSQLADVMKMSEQVLLSHFVSRCKSSALAWSSFGSNAHGQPDALVRRHAEYLALGRVESVRREAYRALFETPLDSLVVDAIRRATSKGIVLGFNDGVRVEGV